MTTIANSQTRILDPSFDIKNFRAEWRLPTDSVFQANWRLCGVGISNTNGAFQGGGYARTQGVLSAIRSIQLYDGAELLDQIADMDTYSSWKGLNKTNDANISTARWLAFNQLGFGRSGLVKGDVDVDTSDILIKQVNPVLGPIEAPGDPTWNPYEGWINLQECLSFLKASMVVPSTVYKQLRLVVTYKSALELSESVTTQKTLDGYQTMMNANLVVEEIADGPLKVEMSKQYTGVLFSPYEFDSVQLSALSFPVAEPPAADKIKEESTSFILHGFNNKKLKKMLIVKKPTDPLTWQSNDGDSNLGYGNKGSTAFFKEVLQCRINGVNKIAGAGVEGKNRRLAMLTDTFGDINIIQGQQLMKSQDYDKFVGPDYVPSQGEVDFGGMIVDDYVNTLQLFITRTGLWGADSGNRRINQACRVIVMGQTEKVVMLDGKGGYRISYTQP